jgi:hypothetical protein
LEEAAEEVVRRQTTEEMLTMARERAVINKPGRFLKNQFSS